VPVRKRVRPRNLRRRLDLRGLRQTTGDVSFGMARVGRCARAYQTEKPVLKLQERLRTVILCTFVSNRFGADGALLPAGLEATVNGMHIGSVVFIGYHNAEGDIVRSVARRAAVVPLLERW